MKGYFSCENSCAISNCLSSSRLKMITRRGLYCSITVLRKCLPNDPVPPVTRTDLSLRSSQGWEKSRNLGVDAPPGWDRDAGAMARADGLMKTSCLIRPSLTENG